MAKGHTAVSASARALEKAGVIPMLKTGPGYAVSAGLVVSLG